MRSKMDMLANLPLQEERVRLYSPDQDSDRCTPSQPELPPQVAWKKLPGGGVSALSGRSLRPGTRNKVPSHNFRAGSAPYQ